MRSARNMGFSPGRSARGGATIHSRLLTTPREMRNALVYVLNNWRKHIPGARGVDPRSSGRWFSGWQIAMRDVDDVSPVAMAETWLGRVGWRRYGPIAFDEA